MGERILDRLGLPEEPKPGDMVTEILGFDRVLIEGHLGVTAYGRTRICVAVRCGRIVVEGSGLELCRMTSQMLVIRGRIHSVALERRT